MLGRPRVHFIENHNRQKQLGPDEWESGYWHAVGRHFADSLKHERGGIYFHTKQAEPSYDGGIVTDYYVVERGEWKGRYVFLYRRAPEFRGVSAGSDGWYRHMKRVP